MEKGREWQRVKEKCKRAYQRYDRMMEKQGFYYRMYRAQFE